MRTRKLKFGCGCEAWKNKDGGWTVEYMCKEHALRTRQRGVLEDGEP